jgi:hypothetical protein
MADFGFNTNIPQGVQPLRTNLADMVNTAAGLQSYQQAREVNPLLLQQAQQTTRTGQIALGVEEQKNTERNNVMQFMSNPENYQTNGRIDIDKMNKSLPAIAPLTHGDVISRFTTLGQAQTQAIDAKQKLTQEQRSIVASRFAILGRSGVQDKNAYLREMELLKQENPENPDLHRLIDAYKTTWADIQSGPNLPGIAIAGAQTLLKPSEQQALAPTVGTLSTGAQVFPTITTPSVGGMPPSIQVGRQAIAPIELPPGSRMVDTGRVDVHNNPIFNVFDATGRAIGQVTVPTNAPESSLPGATPTAPRPVVPQAAAPAAPSMGVVRMPANETEATMTAARNIQLTANKAATSVPQSQFNANQIIKLADEAATGRGADLLQGLTGGYAGLGLVGSTNMADALNKLGHYMALETANLASASGLGTDAARGIAERMTGTTSWTADAIKSTARINRAMSTGIDLFNQGVNNAVAKANNSPIAAREFQNMWSQVAEVNAFRLMDAIKNNDTVAGQELIKELGGPNSPKLKQLKLKVSTINNMIGGQ